MKSTLCTLTFAFLCMSFPYDLFANTSDACMPTQSDVMGPYYLPGSPFRTDLAGAEEPGDRIMIKGKVLHSDCITPVQGVLVEVWQTDSQGKYYDQHDGYKLRGQIKTDEKGHYEFKSIKPGRYGIRNQYRPAHIHFRVSHPDYETLVTQLYFEGDPYLWPNDSCGSYCKSNDPQRIIKMQKEKFAKKTWLEGRFDIILNPLKR